MDAPLVNDYKKDFIISRLLTTFLGGLRLYFTSSVPIYVYLIQIILFAFVPCACGILLHLMNKEICVRYIPLANGLIILIYVIFIQIFALCLQKQKLEKEELEQVDSFGDEEVFLFDSIFGPKTWLFLIPPKRSVYSIFLNACVAGLVSGFTLYYLYLEPEEEEFLLWNQGLRWAFTILSVFTHSVGIWPLVVGSPPEPAVFHQLPYDLQDLSRSSHMLTCILIHGIASLHPSDLGLFYANCFGHAMFAFSPVLWLIGALPPIDSYVLWVLEQWLVVFLGGSPTASNWRLVFHCVIGTLSLLVLAAMPNVIALAVVSSVVGFLLSLDWASLLPFLRARRVQDASGTAVSASLTSGRLSYFSKQELIFYGILLLGNLGLSLAVHLPHLEWHTTHSEHGIIAPNDTLNSVTDLPPIFKSSSINVLWLCLIFLCMVMMILHNIQKPFVMVWLRNPLFKGRKNYSLSPLRRMFNFIRCGGPFVSLLFIHALVGASIPELSFGESFRDSFVVAISFGFIFRQVWQAPEHTLIVLSTFLAVEKIGGEALRNSRWGQVTVSIKIHLFILFLRWLKGTLKKLKTIFMFSLTSIWEPKQRKLINYFLVGMNLGLIPMLFLLSCFSSILCFPLFPLFTLPLFLIGFPRPLRFWSYPVGYSANHCPDTIYYEQLSPYVTNGFHHCFLSGSLGIVYAGEFFLLRWEDRLFWVQVLESGFIYVSYSFKGLELQETSCHTTEASRVDSIFSRAFDNSFIGGCCFNQFFFHCLTPVSTLTAVGYSDTRNVLTGVLDSPETLKVIKDYFRKALLYFLLNHALVYNEKSFSAVMRPASAISRLSSADAKTRKAFANLPKAERIGASRVSVYTPSQDESPSVKSQNGRGSRMAWVSENKLANSTIMREVNGPAVLQQASIQEEREMVVVRPVSWDSSNDPLETKSPSNIEIKKEKFPSQFTVKENDKGKSKPRTIHSSEAKSYVTSCANTDDVKLINSKASGMNEAVSESESETESMREFFDKSVPQRPQQKNHESESADLSEKHIGKVSQRTVEKNSNKPPYKNSLSESLSPCLTWVVDLPFDEETLEALQDSFPLSWFKFLLKRFAMLKINQMKSEDDKKKIDSDERALEQLLSDEFLEEGYRKLLAVIHLIILGSDISFPTTSQVFKIFNGEIPVSKGFDWLKTKERLLDIVLKSYRIAVKLSLDHVLVCPVNNCWTEMESELEEYNCDWYIGPDKETQRSDFALDRDTLWNQAIKKETPSLFSLGYNEVKGLYTSHLLTLGEAEISMGRLDDETVRSIWASLTGELLYFTNDDDERYSIQAHPVLLRNLTIQAADPPLGYPIYSSPPISLGLSL